MYTFLPVKASTVVSETDLVATSLFDSLKEGTNITISLITISGDEKIKIDAAGSGLSGSGTTDKITKWTGATTLGDSILSESASVATITGDVIITGLTISQIVETDGSKQLISVAKGTAYNKAFGSGAGTVCEGNDARLSDARTPLAHTIASHSDTTATGAELETLTNGSNADSLHSHVGDGNGIYTGSGSLSGATVVTMATNNLQFDSTGLTGLFKIDAVNDIIDIGTALRLEPSGASYFNGGALIVGATTTTAERLHVKGAATSGSIIRNIFEGVSGVAKTNVTEVKIDSGTGNGNSGYKLLHLTANIVNGSNNDTLYIQTQAAGGTVVATQNIIRVEAGNALGAIYDALSMNLSGSVVVGEAINATVNVLSSGRSTKRFTVVHNDTNVGTLGNLSHWGGYIANTVTSTNIQNAGFIRYGLEVVSTGGYTQPSGVDTLSIGLKVTSTGADHNFAIATGGGNIGIGGQLQGDLVANNVMYMFNGTAPTASALPLNAFKMYAADIVAGNSAPHFMTENNDIIKLYKQVALTAVDATAIDATYDAVEQGVLNNVRTRLNEIETILQNLGLL